MTNREALEAVLQVDVDRITVEKAMIDVGIDPEDTYGSSLKKKIDGCAVSILQGILSRPDITEGGYSVKYDRSAIQARIDSINGVKPKTAQVRIRNLW